MAIVPDPRWRVLDAAGNALVGATMTVYVAGGTTPASIFSDVGLTTPITLSGANATDAQGYFPQWFAAEGSSFDITIKDSSGATVPDRTYVSVPSLGADTGAVTRDFGAGGRLRIFGSGGVVRFEAGPPTGDDIGGSATLGGYAGSQADLITLDGAAVGTTGVFTENGKELVGVVSTEATFASAATVIIPLVGSSNGLRVWEVEIIDLVTSGALDVQGRVSFDGGTTYYSTANYSSYNFDLAAGTSSNSTAAAQFRFIAGINNAAANHKADLRIRITTHLGAGDMPRMRGAHEGPSEYTAFWGHIAASGIATPATHLKLMTSTGTISGRYRLIPQRGFA